MKTVINPLTRQVLNIWSEAARRAAGLARKYGVGATAAAAGTGLGIVAARKRKPLQATTKTSASYRPSVADQKKYGLDKYGDLVDARTKHIRRMAGKRYP